MRYLFFHTLAVVAIAPTAPFDEVPNPAFPALPPKPAKFTGRFYTPADWEPYFAKGSLAEAKGEFVQGHFATALALLEREGDSTPVRFLRALSNLRAENYRVAAEEFLLLADVYPGMRDRCLMHAALANEELSEWEASASLFSQVDKGSSLFPDARLGLARVLRRVGKLEEAIEALEPIAQAFSAGGGRDYGADALIALADLFRSLKKLTEEHGALIRLWSEHPLSAFSAVAEKRLKGIKLPLRAYVERAERLIDAHQNKNGLTLLRPLLGQLSLPDALACRARYAYGRALRKERKHAEAILVLAPLAEKCRDPELRPRVLYALGGSCSIVDADRALATYGSLVHDFPGHPLADDALFYSAELHLKEGDWQTALKEVNQLPEQFPNGDFRHEALFKAFWIYRTQGDSPHALKQLDRIEENAKALDDSYELERGRYWRARLLLGLGDGEKAVQIWEDLAANHPAGFYGLLAVERLEKLDKGRAPTQSRLADPPAAPTPWRLNAGPLSEDRHFLAGIELLRLGFPERAASEFLVITRFGLPADSLRVLVLALAAAGDARSAHAVARLSLRKDFAGKVTSENRAEWELAYPRPFRELIEKYGREAKVDPDLLQALIREEGALDTRALSSAGALGLTQLMLPTAKAIGRRLGIRTVTAKTLLQPDQSIRLGAVYLAELIRQFGGNEAYALAAYNAGPLPVRRWLAAFPGAEPDEWIEQVPIAETRGYIKRVLRSYHTYRLLHGTGGE